MKFLRKRLDFLRGIRLSGWVNSNKNMKTYVDVGYPSEYFSAPDHKFESLAAKFNGNRNGSGCGFGQRDMHFDFPTKKEASGFVKECKGIDWGFKIVVQIQK